MHGDIGQLLAKRAFLSPHLEAIVEPDTGRRFTYRELDQRTNRVANALIADGVGPGDRVGMLMMNGVEFIETFMAIAKIGAVVVPLNWRLVPDELEFILHDSGTRLLVYGSAFAASGSELQRRGDKTDVTRWIQLGVETAPFAIDYEAWTGSQPATAPSPPPDMAGSENRYLFIMYTSGTTGLPKGVVHSHATMLWTLLTVAATIDIRYRDRYLVSLPLFHVGALAPTLVHIYAGATMIVPTGFDPRQSWELFGAEKVTSGLLVPAMLQLMLAVHDPSAHDASTVRWILSGAAPVPVTLIKAYEALAIEVHQIYGLTESGGPACVIAPEDALVRAGSTGKAFFHTDVKIVRDDGSECAPGEPGELVVRGPHVMVGYWNRPDATAAAIRDGWLHTGDGATMDADGFVTIMDRIKDMLISGGENVYPAEIENVLLSNPKVADAAVIGVPSERWGESPLAVIVRRDAALTADEVIASCHGRLAPFKMVKAVEFVDEIPRNPSGKILKRVLRDRFTAISTE